MIYSTVKIVTDSKDGTGFIVDFSLNKNFKELVLITNKHVVENESDFKIVLSLQTFEKKIERKSYVLKDFRKKYVEDDRYDLCAISLDIISEDILKNQEKIVAPHITLNDICGPDELNSIDAIIDVYVVGYPFGFIDDTNNLPVVKKGITSTPLYSDFEGMAKFLLDAGIMPANSGSPVYFRNDDGVFRLVGIVYLHDGHFLECIGKDQERSYVNIPTGLGVAIKSSVIFEIWKQAKENW